jgi:hypothetical protein
MLPLEAGRSAPEGFRDRETKPIWSHYLLLDHEESLPN